MIRLSDAQVYSIRRNKEKKVRLKTSTKIVRFEAKIRPSAKRNNKRMLERDREKSRNKMQKEGHYITRMRGLKRVVVAQKKIRREKVEEEFFDMAEAGITRKYKNYHNTYKNAPLPKWRLCRKIEK